MSRSKPSDNTPNPSTRWFEWSAKHGRIRYYDKDKQQEVEISVVPPQKPFKFLVLDELACITGYHKPSKSRVFSNDVRDTRQSVLVVKSKKEGTMAEGLYQQIKDRISKYGKFTSHLYIAFKGDDGQLAIGSLHLRGAALGPWMDFRKANRSTLYEKAVAITGFKEDTSGDITFRAPTFAISETTTETDRQALALDGQLQKWLDVYMASNTRDQADVVAAATTSHVGEEPDEEFGAPSVSDDNTPITDDDIPF